MAKTKQTTEVAVKQQAQLSLIDDMAADAGAGMEGAGADSFAIPFLNILQKGSPQVDKASGAAIKGAEAGMIFESVTGRMFDGDDGVMVVPCAYRRVFIHWGARGSTDGGFKGELSADVVATMRSQGKIVEADGRLYIPLADGTVNTMKCDRVSDTRNHFVLLLDKNGSFTQALISLTSTQIKKSKVLMSALASVKVNSQGGPVTPATFANRVRMTTVPEQNDKGTWFGVKFELDGFVEDKAIYAAAKRFYESVAQGTIQAKYEDMGAPDAGPKGF